MPELPLTLGLLCGGQARRLGVAKETLLGESGQTLLEHQVGRMRDSFVETLLLLGDKELAHDQVPPGVRRVGDPSAHRGQGPLAGLLAGLRACSTDWLALLPVDNPFFPPRAFREVLGRAGPWHRAVGFLDHEDRFQWLPGLYHRDLIGSLEQTLIDGELGFGRWVQGVQRAFLPWVDEQVCTARAFTNLNTPEAVALAGFSIRP